jgi:ubiquinone/menaquinone biosynthesis C-methylase UbiE
MSTTSITDAVRHQYGAAARSDLDNRSPGVQAVAEAFGYSADELLSIPAEANMGLSCGNPVATAHLKPGEVVVDLGSGGGLDVFLAAQKVGPSGKSIGIDMTPEMVERARAAGAKGVDGKPFTNVEFHLATIDKLPLADGSVDVILSNCVINLAPDKSRVFREMFRVLKPGGRVAVSDIVLKKPLPEEIRHDVSAYVGCIAGAITASEYERGLRDAGFEHVAVVDAKVDLNAYAKVDGQSACCSPTTKSSSPQAVEPSSGCCSPITSKSVTLQTSSCCGGSSSGHDAKASVHEHLSELMRKYDVNEFACSMKIFAVKPR